MDSITNLSTLAPQSMEQLLRRTYPVAAYHCAKYLDDPALIPSTTREILALLHEQLDKLESPGAYLGWVSRTCARVCVNALRRGGADLQFAVQQDSMPEVPDAQIQPEQALDNAHSAAEAEKCVDGLPLAERLCLYLYYLDELSCREIAHLFGVSEYTIQCTLTEARLLLGKIPAQPYSVSPLPYLHYYLTRRMSEWDDQAEARMMVRSILNGEPTKVPPALPPRKEEEELAPPDFDTFPDIQPLPHPEEAPESHIPLWLIFAITLLAIALGLTAAVILNGASFAELMEKVLNAVF